MDWERIVTQTGAPPNIDAAGTSTPAQVFAAVIYARVTRAYPTAALSSRIAAGTFVPATQQKPLTQFFQNNGSALVDRGSQARQNAGGGPAVCPDAVRTGNMSL